MAFDLTTLPSLRAVIAEHDLSPTKKLGQNFILDLNVTDKIAKAAGNLSHHHIIEIGPGPGGLTRSILMADPLSLTAIEYDDRAINALQSLVTASETKLKVLKADALNTDLKTLTPSPRIIIANLPYNISTVLLLRWLLDIYNDPHSFDRLILMFQKEVAERITALPNTEHYGRLSVITNWLCDTRILFDLPPSVFTPPPKVTSSIVEITPKFSRNDKANFQTLEKIVGAGFGQRRKMIRSSMHDYKDTLEALGIDTSRRAETLSIDEFIKIAEQV